MNDVVSADYAVKKKFGEAISHACLVFIAYLDEKTGKKHLFEPEIIVNTSREFKVTIKIKTKGLIKKVRIVIRAGLAKGIPLPPPHGLALSKLPDVWKGNLNFSSPEIELPGNEIYHQLTFNYCGIFHQKVLSYSRLSVGLMPPRDPKTYKKKLAKKMLTILEAEPKTLLASIIATTGEKHKLESHHSFIPYSDRVSASLTIRKNSSYVGGNKEVLDIEAVIKKIGLIYGPQLIFSVHDLEYETVAKEFSRKFQAALEAGTNYDFDLQVNVAQ